MLIYTEFRKTKINIKQIFVLFLLFLPLYLLSSPTNLRFEKLTIDDGLSQSAVYSIIQDKLGFMWFGTQDGLNRYDGYSIKIYSKDKQNTKSISSSIIRVILEDSKGVLWIGTYGGLSKYNREDDSFINYFSDSNNPNSLSINKVRALFEDVNGVLWIGTWGGGLNRFEENEGFRVYKSKKEEANSLSNNYITSIYEDSKGFLWIGTWKGGLNRLNKERDDFKKFINIPDDSTSISNDTIRTIFMDSKKRLWIGTRGGGLDRLDRKNNIFIHYKKGDRDKFNLSNNDVFSILEDRAGNLWIGTKGGGLNKFNYKSGKFFTFKNSLTNHESLSNDNVFSIYEDNSGILWIGTYGGSINTLNMRQKQFKHYKSDPLKKKSLTNNNIRAIYETNDGLLYIGTDGGGLNLIDREKNIYNQFETNNFSSKSILSICEDNAKNIWIGTRGDGLFKFNSNIHTFVQYQNIKNDKGSLSNNNIMTIFKDSSGNIWIGTYGGGLSRFIKNEDIFTNYKHNTEIPTSISDDRVFTIKEDSLSNIWIGTYGGGLNKLIKGTNRFIHYKNDPLSKKSINNDNILSLYIDKTDTLWIGTDGGGLNRMVFNKRGEISFSFLTTNNGIPNNVVYGILEDDNNNIWISTNRGLAKIGKTIKIIENFNKKDGLQSNEFNQGAFFKSRKGTLYFGGINGFNAFSPKKLSKNLVPPKIIITEFKKFNRSTKLKTDISVSNEIILSYSDSIFSFEFAAMDFTAPQKNLYSYKLEGFNDEWIDTDAKRRIAQFSNISPGKYRFIVKGSNSDRIWNDTEKSIHIIIIPPIWKRWWFLTIGFFIAVFLSYYSILILMKIIKLSKFWKSKLYINNYRIDKQIGIGGMSVVYKVKKKGSKNVFFAIKLLKEEYLSDFIMHKRFFNESTIIDTLDHPNIVKVFERGEYKKSPYLVMELLIGMTLMEKIRLEKFITIKESIRIINQIIDAISTLHKQGIIHRDIKPDNIMLIKKDKKQNFVKILDFGLAKTEGLSRLTETGMVVGTIYYMAPEQIFDSKSSNLSDIYSIGVVFYEMLTGEKPFYGETTIEIMNEIVKGNIKKPSLINKNIGNRIESLIINMMDTDPKNRPGLDVITMILNKILIQETLN